MTSSTTSPTKHLIASTTSPTKHLSTQSTSRPAGSDFYRLAESSSNKALNAFGLSSVAGGGGREGRKHRRGSRDSRESLLPHSTKTHLTSLFREIETEFEKLYVENVRLKEQVCVLEKACPDHTKMEADDTDGFDMNVIKSFTKKNFPKTRHKLKAQTSKIVSSFKTSAISCSYVTEYRGHRDGIWDVSVSSGSSPVLGTASADRTARVWSVERAKCLMRYTGHQGSVNSVQFHPGQELVITGSGDGTAHVWSRGGAGQARLQSSEEEADSSDDGLEMPGGNGESMAQSQAMVVLSGHQGVVVSADWLAGGDQAVTASWDRTAALWDVSTQTMLQSLAGHDMELTGAACHPANRLIVTSSKDTTFRLWDFRETIHSVSVFQGHTDSVTCAAFSRSEHIVSGSDDRTVKVWDLRNMRAPLTNIQTDSQVNKLSISSGGMVAVPQDNRHVCIYDISGNKLARLPRESSKCHMRMVSSVVWAMEGDRDNWKGKANLFSVGFDRVAMGWRVKSKEEQRAM
eukprot:TRINITY_DN21950_c0_g1_i1.p1 TRINITY_DN21950_c0_g1~~TRINITY_DN21950_c0_g1_i1.p1  ORF type:complete len:516 (-),score=173.40 TRINITY_DN21950_c0_g1_i1:139-1686(-)